MGVIITPTKDGGMAYTLTDLCLTFLVPFIPVDKKHPPSVANGGLRLDGHTDEEVRQIWGARG